MTIKTKCQLLLFVMALTISGCGIYQIATYKTQDEIEAEKTDKFWKQHGFPSAEAKLWLDAGFYHPQEAIAWKNAGITYPPEAATFREWFQTPENMKVWESDWEQAGYTREKGVFWYQTGLKTFGSAQPWILEGFTSRIEIRDWLNVTKDAKVASSWKKANCNPQDAEEYSKYGLSSDDAVKLKRRFPSGIENLSALLLANPYDTKGRCFEFVGQTLSLITRTVALYKADSHVFLVDFGESSAPYVVTRGLAEGVGVYSYRTMLGSVKIVPRLKVISYVPLDVGK